MVSGDILHKEAYLYKVYDGVFVCHKGCVIWRPRGNFAFCKDIGYQLYTVSNSPEVVYWDNMWMLERDDNKARDIFNRYYEEKIAECQAKISRIQDKMIAAASDIREGV